MSANGHFTDSELAPIAGVPGTQLANAAAAAWNAMAAHILRESGQRITVNGPVSAYRTVAQQVQLRNYWCSQGLCRNAAEPGTSNHGLGMACDVPDATKALIAKYGKPFGWDIACSDAPWEGWHHKWCEGWSGKDPGPDYEAEPEFPLIKRGDRGGAVKRAQEDLVRWNRGITRPEPNGVFDEETRKAAVEFQVCHHLDVDGIIGHDTWQRLRLRDPLTEQERLHVNRLRLLERGDVKREEQPKAHDFRVWLARRALWIEGHGESWWTDGRHTRHAFLKREAGLAYKTSKQEREK